MNNILISGGTGRLAHELSKHLEADYFGMEDWDFTYPIKKLNYDLVVHMGAYTNVVQAEREKEKCFQTNAFGTFNMVETYKDTPFVYISTEYANKPLGVYALTKRLGEEVVKTHPNHLIIRTAFKPTSWPFEYAYEDQYTQGDYVDVIAKLIAEKIENWDKKTSESCYVGTGRKTMLELARRTKPDVKPNKIKDYTDKIGLNIIPYDYE